MAKTNLKKIALVGAAALTLNTAVSQKFSGLGDVSIIKSGTGETTDKSDVNYNHPSKRLNVGVGVSTDNIDNKFAEVSLQYGKKNFFVGPYMRLETPSEDVNTEFERFKTQITNKMYSITDQYTDNSNNSSFALEGGLKLSQKVGPLELSLNGGMNVSERWAKRAVYGNDYIVDKNVSVEENPVRNEDFRMLDEKISPKKISYDIVGSAEVLLKPVKWLGLGAGAKNNASFYLTARTTLGGRKK